MIFFVIGFIGVFFMGIGFFWLVMVEDSKIII